MTDQESSAILKADEAHKNYEQTVLCRDMMQGEFLKLGSLLKQSRDESLYKFIGYDDFNSYLGAPELGFHRSTAYKLIAIVELYLDKLNIDPVRLIKIGSTKLDKIKDVVEDDVEGWLDRAAPLSVSSLNETIGRGPGKSSLLPTPVPAPPMTCINGCGPGEKSHFPISRGAGQDEVKDWWLPMCHGCHMEFHQDPKEWTWKYRKNWAKWFYSNIIRGE
jgi:hypothetical protein